MTRGHKRRGRCRWWDEEDNLLIEISGKAGFAVFEAPDGRRYLSVRGSITSTGGEASVEQVGEVGGVLGVSNTPYKQD